MLDRLSALLYKLPGIGKRSAEKLALHLALEKEELLPLLQQELSHLVSTVKICKQCGNLSSTEMCSICSDPNRQKETLCIVKDISDLIALEKTELFKGRYFILGNLLSARTQMTPQTLRLDVLKAQIKDFEVKELIFALPLTIEGKTTCHYIQNECPGLIYTELAHGLPIGGNLEYMDEGTIAEAFKRRVKI
ncbi:MAG: recombination protein RecR [Alphaproteobacteria bacterium]|nr:recombination protein RecR [Alphaproteobacteria bacterium]MBN2779612.1 recombination protein RecR [Alphaproteobacteria bacterium]